MYAAVLRVLTGVRLGVSGRKVLHRAATGTARSLALAASLSLAIQPIAADFAFAQEIIIDPSGNVGFAPRVQKTAPAPVIDIARPNAGGVSQNKYTRFNVGTKGAVLNNSKTNTTTTVAGAIAGNPNLADGTATTIINEVTSTEATSMTGTLEVAGDRAAVIVANPNGITCNGCGFLNATGGTLTTGTPMVDGANVTLDVTKGAVTIGRKGLDGSATGQVNLIGRTVIIDGKVTAINGITVQGGAQLYDLTNATRLAKQAGSGTKPDFAIDGTQFGAMEAGRIQVIGNENGLGVRSYGAAQATTGGVSMSSQGDLDVRSVSARGGVTLRAARDTVLGRDVISATGKVTASAGRTLTVGSDAGLFGATGIDLTATSGALTYSGELQSDTGAVLSAGTDLTFDGYATVRDGFRLQAGASGSIKGATVTAARIEVQDAIARFELDNAALFSTVDVNINAGQFRLGSNVILKGVGDASSRLVAAATGDFLNGADLRQLSADTITYGGSLINEASGIIEAATLTRAGSVYNAGVLMGTGTLTLDVGSLFNRAGGLITAQAVQVNARDVLENAGTIRADSDVALTVANRLTNAGLVQALTASLTAPVIENTASGTLRVNTNARLTATTRLDNAGLLASMTGLRIDAGAFSNTGGLTVDTRAEVYADAFDNAGVITAGTRIDLLGRNALLNSGTVASYDDLYVTSNGTLTNTGALFADDLAQLRAGALRNTGDVAILRSQRASLLTASVVNSGAIHVNSGLSLTGMDLFDTSGTLTAAGGITLGGRDAASQAIFRSGSVTMSGLAAGTVQEQLTGRDLNVTFDTLVLNGTLSAGGDLRVTTPDALTLNGALEAGEYLYLNGGTLAVNASGRAYAADTIYLTALGGMTNRGVLASEGDLRNTANFGGLTNTGAIAVRSAALDLRGGFSNSGVFSTTEGVNIRAASLTNTGSITAGTTLSLNAQQFTGNAVDGWVAAERGGIQQSGTLTSEGAMTLTGNGISLNAGSITSAARLAVTAEHLHTRGALLMTQAAATSGWSIGSAYVNAGTVFSEGHISITTGTANTATGSLLGATGNVVVTTATDALLRGSMSGAYVAVNAANRIETWDGFAATSAGNLRLAATDGSVILRGEALAGALLNVIAGTDITVAGTGYGSSVSLNAARDVNINGRAIANGTLTALAGRTLNVRGETEARDLINARSTGGTVVSATGSLRSTDVTINAGASIDSYGRIEAGDEARLIAAGNIVNRDTGVLKATSAELSAATFLNFGNVEVYGLAGTMTAGVDNRGSIVAQTYLGLEAASLVNRAGARLVSDDYLYVHTTTGQLTNEAGATIRGGQVDLRVGQLWNGGLIDGRDVVNVVADRSIGNAADGTIVARTVALIAATSVTNNGRLGRTGYNTDAIDISAGTGVSNGGTMLAKEIRLLAHGGVTNTGTVQARDFLGVTAETGSVTNGGTLYAGMLEISAANRVTNTGLIRGLDGLAIGAGEMVVNTTGVNAAGEATTGSIYGDDTRIIAGGTVQNKGSLRGTTALSVQSTGGNIANEATLAGATINLVARNGLVRSTTAIVAGKDVNIDANRIDLQGSVRATDRVQLLARRIGDPQTGGDITLGSYLAAEDVLVQAADTLSAIGGSLRGSTLTQVIAGDILRTDLTDIDNRKLGIVHGGLAKGNIYVRLTQGDLGQWDTTAYESVNWNVTGNATIIADRGNVLLSGTIRSGGATSVQAFNGGNLAVRTFNAGLGTAGGVVHLEASALLRNNGGLNIAAGSELELVMRGDDFRTSDWLKSRDVAFGLTVEAKTVEVDSSHRFDGTDLFLKSQSWLKQIDQVMTARGITYAANGNLIVDFDPFAWRAAHPNAANVDGDAMNVFNNGLSGVTLRAQGAGILLYAGNDITLTSGKLITGGTLSLTAGRNITANPLYRTTTRANLPAYVGWSFSNLYAGPNDNRTTERRAYVTMLTGTRGVELFAGNTINLIGTQITSANGNIDMQAFGGINLAAAAGYREYEHHRHSSTWYFLWTEHTYEDWYQWDDIYTPVSLKAANGTVNLVALGDVLSAGTQITSGGALTIASAARNVVLGTYDARHIDQYNKSTKNTTFFGLVNLGGSTVRRSSTAVATNGNNFLSDTQLTLSAANDLRIIGGQLTAPSIILRAGRDLYIDGAISSTREDNYSQRNNFITITTIQSGFNRESVAMPEIRAGNLTFDIGGDVHIAGWRGNDLNAILTSSIAAGTFDTALEQLYTSTEAAGANAAAQSVSNEYMRDYVLPGASTGAQYAYLDTLLTDYNATYHTISLRDHSWYDKQVQLNPAFQALLTVAVTAATGGIGGGIAGMAGITNSIAASAFNAAVANFTTSAIGGAITGSFDLGDALRNAVIAGGTSFIAGHINDTLGFSSASGSIGEAGSLQAYFAPDEILNRLGGQVVNTSVGNVLNGRDPFDGIETLLQNFVVSETMALAQFGVGELGNGMQPGEWEGSIGHMLLHGGVGCVAMEAIGGNCTAGFFSGVGQSLLAGSDLTDDQKLALAPLAGALGAFFFADGNAVNVSFGSQVATSGLLNNYLTHRQLAEIMAADEKCGDDEACRTRVRDAARVLSLAQDAKFASDWAECKLGNQSACGVLQTQLIYINGLTVDDVMADIRSIHPDYTEAQLQSAADRYLVEFRNSYDDALWRFTLGSLDVLGTVSAGGGAVLEDLGAGAASVLRMIAGRIGSRTASTGTVWDDILATAADIPGTRIPATFEVRAGEQAFWVNANATEHFGEYLTRLGASGQPISSQEMLRSFQSAVNTIAQSGPPTLGRLYNVGGWEIVFRQGANDRLPVIVHAFPTQVRQ